MYIREDTAIIAVNVNGVAYDPPTGSWFSLEGGNLEAEDSKTRPGGMGDEVAVGGPASRDDVTVKTQLTDIVIASWHKPLEALVGRSAPATVGYQFLSPQKVPTGPVFTLAGVLKSAFLPDIDTGSSDVSMYTVVISLNELAA